VSKVEEMVAHSRDIDVLDVLDSGLFQVAWSPSHARKESPPCATPYASSAVVKAKVDETRFRIMDTL
jgi:hypothetical protein